MTTPSSPAHHYLVYLPIGKLTTAQLKMGYIALKKIEELINKKIKGDALIQACDQFYTRIPHDYAGRSYQLEYSSISR